MVTIYNAEKNTGEYLQGQDYSPRQNPMWAPETHSPDDRWLYNPKTSSLQPPLETSEHEVAILENGEWVVKPDYREMVYYDTSTQERHEITELGVVPDSGWIEKEPPAYSKWNGNDWEDDLSLWLDNVVRPQRDAKLSACDYTMMPDYPIDQSKRAEWETYRGQLRDLPATLTAVTDSVLWPLVPA